jgi:MGT family glycosyltransferase
MEPMHVCFNTAAATGHVNPVLAIVSELVRRGHRVTCATTDRFAPLFALAGAQPVVYTSTLPTDPGRWPTGLWRTMLLFQVETEAVLPQLEDFYRGDRPDVVLSEDPAAPARILAAAWGLPSVQLWPYFATVRHWSADRGSMYYPADDPALDELLARLTALLAARGVGLSAEEFYAARTAGGIVLIPRGFQYNGDSFDSRFTFVGPCLRATTGRWQRPAGAEPVLLVALGSIDTDHPAFYRTCFDAFAELPWHVVMATSGRVDRARLGTVPSNVDLQVTVDQPAVLEQATAFVTHAGMGSTLEALHHGVPMVAIPRLPEQVANARRVVELGLGRQLEPGAVTASTLRQAVLDVATDEAVARRMRAIRSEVRQCGGAPAAADAIERAASRRV